MNWFQQWIKYKQPCPFTAIPKYSVVLIDTSAMRPGGSEWKNNIGHSTPLDLKQERNNIIQGQQYLEQCINGFLNQANTSTVDEVLKEIQKGQYNLEQRMRIIEGKKFNTSIKSREYFKELHKLTKSYTEYLTSYQKMRTSISPYTGNFTDLKKTFPVSKANQDLAAAAYATFEDSEQEIAVFTADQDLIHLLAAYYIETPVSHQEAFQKQIRVILPLKEYKAAAIVIQPSVYYQEATREIKRMIQERTGR